MKHCAVTNVAILCFGKKKKKGYERKSKREYKCAYYNS